MKLLKFCLLFTLLVGMAACSGGGTNKDGVERNSSTTEEGGTNTETPPTGEEPEPTPEPGPGPESPISVLLDGNLYFPIAEAVTWHYDNGDEVTFTTGEVIQGRTLVSMHHSLDAMPREEYLRVTDNEIEYGGLFAFFAYQGAAVAGGVEFHSLRRVYDNILDKGAQSRSSRARRCRASTACAGCTTMYSTRGKAAVSWPRRRTWWIRMVMWFPRWNTFGPQG